MMIEQQLQALRDAVVKYIKAEARLAENDLLNSLYRERDVALAELERVLGETTELCNSGHSYTTKFALGDRVVKKGSSVILMVKGVNISGAGIEYEVCEEVRRLSYWQKGEVLEAAPTPCISPNRARAEL